MTPLVGTVAVVVAAMLLVAGLMARAIYINASASHVLMCGAVVKNELGVVYDPQDLDDEIKELAWRLVSKGLVTVDASLTMFSDVTIVLYPPGPGDKPSVPCAGGELRDGLCRSAWHVEVTWYQRPKNSALKGVLINAVIHRFAPELLRPGGEDQLRRWAACQ